VGGVTLKDIQPDAYWSGTEYGTSTAWIFGFGNGSSGFIFKGDDHHAWAVRPGDSAPIPVPATILLLGSGLAGLGLYRKRMGRGMSNLTI
jgi:hypothetical protein